MMCENQYQYNFPQPWNNSFYYHYLQQHATMSYHFQKLHNNIHYGGHSFDLYNPTNVCNEVDYSSSCSSCSCCSAENCSKASPYEYKEEAEEMDNEGYDEEQYQDEDYDEGRQFLYLSIEFLYFRYFITLSFVRVHFAYC